jgi:hypothetical protein
VDGDELVTGRPVVTELRHTRERIAAATGVG